MLRRRAEEMVQLAEQTRAELLPQPVLAGQISIGCGELRSVQELSQHMHNFQQLHPQVTFDLYTGDNSNIQDRLHQGTLDMGLLLEPVDLSKYNYIRSIPRIRGVPLAFNLTLPTYETSQDELDRNFGPRLVNLVRNVERSLGFGTSGHY